MLKRRVQREGIAVKMSYRFMILLAIGITGIAPFVSHSGLNDFHSFPVTREEAVEISKTSAMCRELSRMDYDSSQCVTHFFNHSSIRNVTCTDMRAMYEKVPDGHGVWDVTWYFHKRNPWTCSIAIVIIDAETGTIVHEAHGGGW